VLCHLEVAPDTPLLYVLRNELGLSKPHFGCGLAQCGACTVHVDGAPTRSCSLPVSAAAGTKVTTLARLGTPDHPHPLQAAFIAEQVPQRGYCLNGWIMTAAALLRDTPHPSEQQIFLYRRQSRSSSSGGRSRPAQSGQRAGCSAAAAFGFDGNDLL
jgi:aerobic-type carbon monoxide dehydrogenase small subunit (CoxS/CutS family)